jgi:hypothetical protein
MVKILLMHLLFVNRLNEQRLENNPYAVQTHVIPPQIQHSFTQSLNRKLMVAWRQRASCQQSWRHGEEEGI